MRGLGLACMALLILAGCVRPAVIQHVGQVAPGEYLATVRVDELEHVRAICLAGHALACAQTFPLPGDRHGVALIFPFPPGWTPNARDVYVVAHELCHVVARLQKLPDPCHDEDRGAPPWEYR